MSSSSGAWRAANPLKYPLLALMVFIYGFSVSVNWPFVALFGVNELGVSSAEIAMMISVVAVSGLVFSHYIGILSDKASDRRIALWAVLLSSIVGCLMFAFVRYYWWLMFCCATFLGIGAASFAQVFALAREHFESDGQGEIDIRNNTLRGIFSLSWVFGPAAGSLMISVWGYSSIFLFAAAGYALLCVFILKLKPRVHIDGHAEAKPPRIPYNFGIYANIAAFGLVSLALNIGTICYPLLINKTHEFSEKMLGVLMGSTAALEIPLMIGAGILAKKVEKGTIVLVGFVIFAAYCFSLYFAEGLVQLFAAQAIAAIGIAVIMGIGMSFCQDLLPGRPGEGTTLFTNASLAGSVGSGLVFALASTWLDYPQVYVLCSALCMLGAFVFWLGNKLGKGKTSVLSTDVC